MFFATKFILCFLTYSFAVEKDVKFVNLHLLTCAHGQRFPILERASIQVAHMCSLAKDCVTTRHLFFIAECVLYVVCINNIQYTLYNKEKMWLCIL